MKLNAFNVIGRGDRYQVSTSFGKATMAVFFSYAYSEPDLRSVIMRHSPFSFRKNSESLAQVSALRIPKWRYKDGIRRKMARRYRTFQPKAVK